MVSKTVESVGSLKALSVSVLVADRVSTGANPGEPPVSTPRSAQELQEIEQMMRSALGINDTRGDLISVVSMPFESSFEEPLPAPTVVEKVYPFMPLIKYVLLAIAALFVYLLFFRPLMKTLRGVKEETQPMKTVEELEAELRGGEGQALLGTSSDPLERLRQEVMGGGAVPVQIIKTWLREEPAES